MLLSRTNLMQKTLDDSLKVVEDVTQQSRSCDC